MNLHSDVRFDFNYVLAENLPDGGLTQLSIESYFPELKRLQKGLNELHRLGQMPWMDLAFSPTNP